MRWNDRTDHAGDGRGHEAPGDLDGPVAMAHPIHLHGAQFRIVGRQHGPVVKAERALTQTSSSTTEPT